MEGVFLDSDSIAPEDLDLSAITGTLDNWTFYPSTLPHERLTRVQGAEVIVTNKIIIDAELMRAANNMKLILVAATGANNIDLDAAQANGIAVANVKGYGPKTVAQHAFALILALATKLINYNDDVNQGRWATNHFFCLLHHPIMELAGKNLVIVGHGEIGQAVAKIAEGFDMNVLVSESFDSNHSKLSDGVTRKPLAELLPIADVLTLHCPLTPETTDLIGQEELATMKSSALLINVSRGGLVNEAALANALINHQIAGAGVDVLTQEPPVDANPLLDQHIPNLIVTPHCAWGSKEARQRLIDELVLNLKAFLNNDQRNRLV